MIFNACIFAGGLVPENICKQCQDEVCRHAGAPITAERVIADTFGCDESEDIIDTDHEMHCFKIGR